MAPLREQAAEREQYEQTWRRDRHVNAGGERVHGLCGRGVGWGMGEDAGGRDREDDRAADLERAADEAGCESLLVVADAGQRLDVQCRVGEREAKAVQQTRG